MRELLYFGVGIFVVLTIILGTMAGTTAAATVFGPIGLLTLIAWPFIGAAGVMFVLWWGDR